MTLAALASRAAERLPVPDVLTRLGISTMVGRTRRKLAMSEAGVEAAFARSMVERPIAEFTQAANTQHYELPPAFFARVLGPRRKYSSCLYEGASTLAEAEIVALEATAAHAGLADGQDVLELGCGWGSLSLWMAERYPGSRITAVSNSAPQRGYIEAEAAARGLGNLRVITADMLTELGYKVYAAESAGAALAALEGGLRPDVVMTDHLMPGMTGVELTLAVRARWPAVKLLLVSGFAEVEGLDPALPRLPKPFVQSELAAALECL